MKSYIISLAAFLALGISSTSNANLVSYGISGSVTGFPSLSETISGTIAVDETGLVGSGNESLFLQDLIVSVSNNESFSLSDAVGVATAEYASGALQAVNYFGLNQLTFASLNLDTSLAAFYTSATGQFLDGSYNLSPGASVPVPASIALVALGLILGLVRQRRLREPTRSTALHLDRG